MGKNAIYVLLGILIVMALCLGGCGGGDGDGETVVEKTSVIDGKWKHDAAENSTTLTTLHLLEDVTFSNGNFTAIEYEPDGCPPFADLSCYTTYWLNPKYKKRTGQFYVVGNVLTLSNIIINDDPTWGTFSSTCNYILNGTSLVLTYNEGTATFFKEP